MNATGDATTSAKVAVKEGVPPQVTQPLKDATLEPGDRLKLTVRFTASPTPMAEWKCNGATVNPTAERRISQDSTSATLTMPHVQENDIGHYSVKLKNQLGAAESQCDVALDEGLVQAM